MIIFQDHCGTDAALFVIFNRYAAIFFACAGLLSAIILIPIYATGDPFPPEIIFDKNYNMNVSLLYITVVNCSGNALKVSASFGIIIAFYTAGTFLLMFKYWKLSLSWRIKDYEPAKMYSDADIAQQSIFVSGIPMNLPLKDAKTALKTVFEKIFSEEKVVAVRIIPKLDDLLGKAEKLKVLREKLAYYRDQNTKREVRTTIK